VIEKGSTTYGVNKAGFTLHSAIHDARNDINAILHVHTPQAAGISALKCGLLPISQGNFNNQFILMTKLTIDLKY
jgi:adducin